jgi:hypothetical protein
MVHAISLPPDRLERGFVLVRIVIGLVLRVAALALAGRRLWWLARVGRSGQPAPERIGAVRSHPARDAGWRRPR